MLNKIGFDLWANDYEKSVSTTEKANEYPFAGYKKVLGTIYDIIKSENGKKILDIGFGTGVLSKKLYDEGCLIYGIDFSDKMIEIAKEKMPNAVLIEHDFSQKLPNSLSNETFDFIVCTYAIHHLNDLQKLQVINELINHLSTNGKVLIGDVAFATVSDLEQCKAQSGGNWDNDENYCVAEFLKASFPKVKFEKISFCAGVLIFPK